MKSLNEKVKQKLISIYKKHNAEFTKLSFSNESKKSCVKSTKKAINGDSFKKDCCRLRKEISSVDAISFNFEKIRFIFIEFKIKKMKYFRNEKLITEFVEEVKKKFEDSWNCVGHQIDTDHLFQKLLQERLLVYEFKDHRNIRLEIARIKTELEKLNINIRNSNSFLREIDNYKFRI